MAKRDTNRPAAMNSIVKAPDRTLEQLKRVTARHPSRTRTAAMEITTRPVGSGWALPGKVISSDTAS
jgi:hypothetical protein